MIAYYKIETSSNLDVKKEAKMKMRLKDLVESQVHFYQPKNIILRIMNKELVLVPPINIYTDHDLEEVIKVYGGLNVDVKSVELVSNNISDSILELKVSMPFMSTIKEIAYKFLVDYFHLGFTTISVYDESNTPICKYYLNESSKPGFISEERIKNIILDITGELEGKGFDTSKPVLRYNTQIINENNEKHEAKNCLLQIFISK